MTSKSSDKVASVFAALLFFGPLILLAFVLWQAFTTDYSQHYTGVTLQKDVLYATTRQWPLAEAQKSPAPVRWLSSDGKSIRLNDSSPNISFGADHLVVLIHGYASQEEDVATYFSGFIDYLRENAEFRAQFIVYDWPSTASHFGQNEMRHWSIEDMLSGRTPGPFSWLGRFLGHEQVSYALDRESAAQTGALGLISLLQTIEALQPKRISIVAHSMGSYVLAKAIESSPALFKNIDRLIFLASDIPADAFAAPEIRDTIASIPKVHVYWSRNDEALEKSRLLNGPRLGMSGPPAMVSLTNVYSHDATVILGDRAVHSKYLTRSGATAVGLAEAFR